MLSGEIRSVYSQGLCSLVPAGLLSLIALSVSWDLRPLGASACAPLTSRIQSGPL